MKIIYFAQFDLVVFQYKNSIVFYKSVFWHHC